MKPLMSWTFLERGQSETGASLEALVFGGTVIHALDDAYDERQPGAPHLIRAQNRSRISQRTVDEFLQCNFKVPFVASDLLISKPLKQIGESYKLPIDSDPMDPKTQPMLRKLVKDHVSNPFVFAELEKLEPNTSTRYKIQVGPQSVLAQKVLRPNLAIKVVA